MEKILAIAFITEAIWETIKLAKQPKGINIDVIGSMVIGIIVAITAKIDIFEVTGAPLDIPILGSVLTGLLLSRGSNFIHDILGSMGQTYQSKKVDTFTKQNK